jgi:hypothetical protein
LLGDDAPPVGDAPDAPAEVPGVTPGDAPGDLPGVAPGLPPGEVPGDTPSEPDGPAEGVGLISAPDGLGDSEGAGSSGLAISLS